MLIDGFILGTITFFGWAFAFSQMPKGVRDFFAQHNFLTDALVILGTYYTLGGTIVALFAAAFLGIFFESFTYVLRNPKEFDWLHDNIKMGKDFLVDCQKKLRDANKEYREQKQLQADNTVQGTVA